MHVHSHAPREIKSFSYSYLGCHEKAQKFVLSPFPIYSRCAVIKYNIYDKNIYDMYKFVYIHMYKPSTYILKKVNL